MFTGIVEAAGEIVDSSRDGEGGRLVVAAPFADELSPGESVAVDGCCLTALPMGPGRFGADLSPQTLALTTLGTKRPGDAVNLERAVPLGGRVGGHLVQGHVDGVARLVVVTPEGAGARHRYECEADDEPFLVPQGSVAVDGVSLTVAAVGPRWFEVALVPHSLEVTTLGRRREGDVVNVEHDLMGKYLLRALALSGRVDLGEGARRRLGLA